MKPIPFFTGDLSVVPHAASNPDHLGHAVTIEDFSGGKPCLVYDLGDSELLVSLFDSSRFMQGPEAI